MSEILAIEEPAIAQPATTTAPRQVWLNATTYLVMAALVAAFYWPVLLPSNGIMGGDYYDFHVPNRVYAATALRSGRIPLWAPEIFGGFPFIGDPQSAVFGPINLLVTALIPNPADSYFFQLYHIFKQLLVALAGVFLARSIGISRTGALVCGTICVFNGYNILHLTHVNMFTAIAGGLFAVGALIRAVHARDVRWSIVAGLAVSGAGLSSHPQLSIHIGYALIAATLFLMLRYGAKASRRDRVFIAWLCALPFIIGAFGTLVQVLPSRDVLNASVRSQQSLADAQFGQFPLDELPALLFPHLYSAFWWRRQIPWSFIDNTWSHNMHWEYTFHFGVVALIFAIIGFRGNLRRPAVWALAVTFLWGWIVALGSATPVFGFLYNWLPGFRTGRIPPRVCWMANAALALLAGFGVDSALNARSQRSGRRALWTGLVFTVVLAAGCTAFLVVERARAANWLQVFLKFFAHDSLPARGKSDPVQMFLGDVWLQIALAAVIVTLLTAWIVLALNRARAGWIRVAAVVLVFGELALYGFHENVVFEAARTTSAIGSEFKNLPPDISGRYMLAPYKYWTRNSALPAGKQLAGGYGPLTFACVHYLLPTENLECSDTFGVASRNLWNVQARIVWRRSFIQPDGTRLPNLGYATLCSADPTLAKSVAWDVTSSQPATRISLVTGSGYTYSRLDGFEVGELNLTDRDGSSLKFPIRVGKETAEWRYDAGAPLYKPAHARPPIAALNPVAVEATTDTAFYLSNFDLPSTFSLARAEVRATAAAPTALFVSHMLVQTSASKEVHSVAECFGWKQVNRPDARYFVTAREDNPGYAWMVPNADVVSYRENMRWVIDRLRTGYDVRRRVMVDKTVFTTDTLDALNAPKPEEFSGKADFRRVTAEHVRITTDANQRGWLVISQAYFDKWRATVDGAPATLAQADGAICAVAVDRGKHVVELKLVWPSVWIGGAISGVTWIAAIGALFVVHRKRR